MLIAFLLPVACYFFKILSPDLYVLSSPYLQIFIIVYAVLITLRDLFEIRAGIEIFLKLIGFYVCYTFMEMLFQGSQIGLQEILIIPLFCLKAINDRAGINSKKDLGLFGNVRLFFLYSLKNSILLCLAVVSGDLLLETPLLQEAKIILHSLGFSLPRYLGGESIHILSEKVLVNSIANKYLYGGIVVLYNLSIFALFGFNLETAINKLNSFLDRFKIFNNITNFLFSNHEEFNDTSSLDMEGIAEGKNQASASPNKSSNALMKKTELLRPPTEKTAVSSSPIWVDQTHKPLSNLDASTELNGFPAHCTTSKKVSEYAKKSLLSTSDHKENGLNVDEITASINKTLGSFCDNVSVKESFHGPSITTFPVNLSSGVKINKILSLNDEISFSIGKKVRICSNENFPLCIEAPNEIRSKIGLQSLVKQDKIMHISIGVDMLNNPVSIDLSKLPHLLIAGTTGSGKSVCVHSIILSLLYSTPNHLLKFLMIDPKMLELTLYNQLPNLIMPVITEHDKAYQALRWAVEEMNQRYALISEKEVRNIESYNAKCELEGKDNALPYIVIIIDEFADLILDKSYDSQSYIIKIAQKARSAGIHFIIATQRPSYEVVTGLLKANIPGRIALKVNSKTDSRIILDQGGAELLLGNGDSLFMSSGMNKPMRVQGAYVSDEEIRSVCQAWKKIHKKNTNR